MGKIVKFCNSCDEGFAEKFGFCPNCGQTLQKFEMNPVVAEAPEEPRIAAPVAATTPLVEPIADPEPEVTTAPEPEIIAAPAAVAATAPFVDTDDTGYETVVTASPEIETGELNDERVEEAEPLSVPAWTAPAIFTQARAMSADRAPASLMDEHDKAVRDGGFYVTVIEEKNVGKRNMLMLGTLSSMLLVLMVGLVVSIFSKDLDVSSINDDIFNAVLVDDVPAVVDAEPEEKDDKDAGGGGGGGNDDPRPAAKGAPPAMMEKPQMAPDPNAVRLTNPTIVPQVGVKGPDRPKIDPSKNYGLLLGADNNSSGPGSGGGIGSGRGGGVGSGDGSGLGSGSGGGAGSGSGGGIGDGNGRGGGGLPPPPPAGVTQQLRIISKPRPGYTDSARQNNVQGTVILRVTFLASGQVGSISAVKGLPNGLTEQAIAAARRISFEPKKIGGVGQPVTRQIEYTFSIY